MAQNISVCHMGRCYASENGSGSSWCLGRGVGFWDQGSQIEGLEVTGKFTSETQNNMTEESLHQVRGKDALLLQILEAETPCNMINSWRKGEEPDK